MGGCAAAGIFVDARLLGLGRAGDTTFTKVYWGPVVGFYGGINYGFGYFGRGYEGGRWEHDHFYYQPVGEQCKRNGDPQHIQHDGG